MEVPLDDMQPEQPKRQDDFGKILLWNFGIMVGFMTLTGLTGKVDSLIIDLILMILQAIANLLLAAVFFIKRRYNSGLACLLSTFLIAIVGAGMCTGKAAIMGG